jgi:hypothetical protein
MGQKVYYAVEDSDCLTRNCCGPLRPFDMKILDNFKNEVIHLNRPLACDSCWFPCCLQVSFFSVYRTLLVPLLPAGKLLFCSRDTAGSPVACRHVTFTVYRLLQAAACRQATFLFTGHCWFPCCLQASYCSVHRTLLVPLLSAGMLLVLCTDCCRQATFLFTGHCWFPCCLQTYYLYCIQITASYPYAYIFFLFFIAY